MWKKTIFKYCSFLFLSNNSSLVGGKKTLLPSNRNKSQDTFSQGCFTVKISSNHANLKTCRLNHIHVYCKQLHSAHTTVCSLDDSVDHFAKIWVKQGGTCRLKGQSSCIILLPFYCWVILNELLNSSELWLSQPENG